MVSSLLNSGLLCDEKVLVYFSLGWSTNLFIWEAIKKFTRALVSWTSDCTSVHWVLLNANSVTTNTRLQRADFFASKSFTAVSKNWLQPVPLFFYQNFTQNSAGITFCRSKPGPCVVITSQISSKFRGLVVYYLLSMPPLVFLVSMLQIVQNFRRKWGEQ